MSGPLRAASGDDYPPVGFHLSHFYLTCCLTLIFQMKCAFHKVCVQGLDHLSLFCLVIVLLAWVFFSLKWFFFLSCHVTEHETLEKNTVLRQALINRTIPKWERRTVQINNFGMTLQSSLTMMCNILKWFMVMICCSVTITNAIATFLNIFTISYHSFSPFSVND